MIEQGIIKENLLLFFGGKVIVQFCAKPLYNWRQEGFNETHLPVSAPAIIKTISGQVEIIHV